MNTRNSDNRSNSLLKDLGLVTTPEYDLLLKEFPNFEGFTFVNLAYPNGAGTRKWIRALSLTGAVELAAHVIRETGMVVCNINSVAGHTVATEAEAYRKIVTRKRGLTVGCQE